MRETLHGNLLENGARDRCPCPRHRAAARGPEATPPPSSRQPVGNGRDCRTLLPARPQAPADQGQSWARCTSTIDLGRHIGPIKGQGLSRAPCAAPAPQHAGLHQPQNFQPTLNNTRWSLRSRVGAGVLS